MTTTYTIGNLTNNNTVTLTGTGSSGSSITYATTATYPVINGGTMMSNGTNYTWSTGATDTVVTVGQNPASLEVTGKIIHNGLDLEERLKTIETVLQIPERDFKLEKKYPKLKKMYDDYIKALGKYRTFEAIKGDNNE